MVTNDKLNICSHGSKTKRNSPLQIVKVLFESLSEETKTRMREALQLDRALLSTGKFHSSGMKTKSGLNS
jgi:hypothetical protein